MRRQLISFRVSAEWLLRDANTPESSKRSNRATSDLSQLGSMDFVESFAILHSLRAPSNPERRHTLPRWFRNVAVEYDNRKQWNLKGV